MSWDLQTTPTFAGYSKSTTESFPAIIGKGGERFYSKSKTLEKSASRRKNSIG